VSFHLSFLDPNYRGRQQMIRGHRGQGGIMAGPSALPAPAAAAQNEPASSTGALRAEAERAFIASRTQMIRTDPHLAEAGKEAATTELRRRARRR
jgi:hypothetical protein